VATMVQVQANACKKKISLEGGHNELMDSHLRDRLLCQMRVKSTSLFRKVKVDYFINERTHKFNVLKF